MSIFDVPLSKALIKSKGARRKGLGRAIVIQKARSNRRWKNTPLARAVSSTSNARFRDRYKTAIRPPARPGSGTGRTTTTPATEAVSSASMFGSVAGSASED